MGNLKLKRKIIEKLDALSEDQLIQLSLVLERLNSNLAREPETKYQLEEWDLMPSWQKQKIEEAVKSLDKGEGIPHEKVMRKMKEKYGF